METRQFTLLSDGTSDQVLVPILQWMLLQHHPGCDWIGQCADLQGLRTRPKNLADRIRAAHEFFPSDLLFVHRDAEKESPDRRREEIASAVAANSVTSDLAWTPVIPVRMTESWLLISEAAIRGAAGNPNGRITLSLPAIGGLERLPDPKDTLETLLVTACELSGRRRKKFRFPIHRCRVPDFIQDWSPLLALPSARAVFDEIATLRFDTP